MKPSRKRVARLLAFGPAVIMVCVTAFVASGASIVGGATAASTVGVSGSVSSTFSTDPGLTGCADETLTSFASAFAASNGCQISFTSNNATGAEVVFDNNNTGVGQSEAFFCSDADGAGTTYTRSCSTDASRLENLVGKGNAIAADTFGLALTAVGGGGSSLTTSAGSGVSAADATPLATDLIWAGVPAQGAAVQLCSLAEPNSTTSTCDFVFGGQGEGATQGAGDYTGTLRLTAQLL